MLIAERQSIKPIIVNAPQRSLEWHQARLGNLTGSDAEKAFLSASVETKNAVIRAITGKKQLSAGYKETDEYLDLFNLNSKDFFAKCDELGIKLPETKERMMYRRTRVAERLTGLPSKEDGFVTQAMKWGTANEVLALAEYKRLTRNIVEDAPFMLHPTLRAGASPDGLVIDRKTGQLGVLENKCLESHNHLYKIVKKQEVPNDYIVQIHMEIWISDRDFCDFIGYDPRLPGQLQIFVKRVWRDDNYINNVLEPEVTRFLEECKRDEMYFRRLSKITKAEENLLYGQA